LDNPAIPRDDTAFSPTHRVYARLFNGSEPELAARISALAAGMTPLKEPDEKFKGLEWPPDEYRGLHSPPLPLAIIQFLVRLSRPKRMLEIGTFVGISACSFAEVLPPGAKLISLEKFDLFAGIARRNVERFGWTSKVDVICCDAFEWLAGAVKREERFDVIFLDGNKDRYDEYFFVLDKLLDPGGLLIVDDVFFIGDALNDPPVTDKAQGVRRLLEVAAKREDYDKVLVPVCDGTLLMYKR